MNRVRIHEPEIRGDTLVGDVSATGGVNRFFSGEEFQVTYSESIEGLPEHIQTIPILAHVCPVAWAAGADVVVETTDADFLKALREIRSTFLDFYPEFMVGGAIHCENPVETEQKPGDFDGSGMLFTGGVDSTATYVRHREEDPTLVSIRGWVIGLDEDDRWAKTRDYVTDFAEDRGHDTAFVESNMLSFLEYPLLQSHFQRHLDAEWYAGVGHGVGLLALCAPLAYVQEWGSLYIAASHTPDWNKPWGSDPDIDDHVQWSGTDCYHDAYDLSRLEKVERIAKYVNTDSPDLSLRTCIYEDGAGNCSDCEKCYRTILELLLAGLDPNKHGYEFTRAHFDKIRAYFESGESYLTKTTRYHWSLLQDAAKNGNLTEYDGGEEFQRWIVNQDFDAYVEESDRPLSRRLIQLTARNTPTPLYSAIYPLYRRVTA